jgi:SAM-dependent methyltransferase
MTVMAAHNWATNADLIADCAKLGYLHEDWLTLDCTYGEGVFWRKFRPQQLVCSDLVAKGDHALAAMFGGFMRADFTALPFADNTFQAVVFDPPYRLNGTPTQAMDERYGIHTPTRWQDRMSLMQCGFIECHRVLAPGGFLLVKCQNQVCSGRVRWQVDIFGYIGLLLGMEKVDQLDFLTNPRPQPEGRRQQHARRNASTLLVFRKP